ncbi:aminotransferase class V-fold PLP-dependent enzyme [Enterovibrio sp. ZSDZ35]|uniref:Aminotransferase class V-fold PLP-dependent enzyme n=1 Tax=Enterovibrio qingdaonensis TaxID=2899818 RepID=A0ABT5QL62_9GAMM|nr:aminotransferase class V-fold PLP-dependent enzyme [Enterovibrio sp. ZSDZ35]MDD1781364.1 aminotransferase class V-fold PLP-dependent enzyme [Enterovibrio sp. ZSDZ35]
MRISAPIVESLDSILPDEPLLMMGAGPVPIPAKVAAANGIVINHLGDTMSRIIEQVKAMSRYVFQTNSTHILGVAGPGSAAMEMAIANLVTSGDSVLSVTNGFFSGRLAEMADRVGGNVHRLTIEEGQAASPEKVKSALNEHRPQVLTIVQGETSNTVCNTALPEICRLAKEAGCLVIVDAVCTLSTMPLNMDEWGVDAVITGGQKGLSCIPGVSLVAFSEAAWTKIEERTDTLKHWCLDAKLADKFWYQSSYHYTAPVSGIMAIHEALRLVCDETLEARFNRHLKCSKALQAGIEGLGLSLYTHGASRLNSVVGIHVPKGLEQKAILSHISQQFKVEISGSFGLDIIRIGQMGEQCRVHNIFRTIHALGSTIQALGGEANLPQGVAMLEKALQDFEPSFT